MAISKSTPYVRYKKDFTSSLHLGTIHIESEYLDRTKKTTIESIHGMTWHNKVVNENKELNLLSDTQLELTELEKQYWNTGEKRVSVDEIHTLEEVEPNEDGTYTYTVNSMEGEYIEIYDGINNITSTSDGLDGQFEIVYDTTEEDINGNIALDQVVSQYEITDSGVGAITNAKSTGLTLVNHITEPSKEEVAAIEQQEGKHFTIENTVQGNIKSAILKGQTLVNQSTTSELTFENAWQGKSIEGNALQSGKKYFASFDLESDNSELTIQARNGNSFVYHIHKGFTKGKNVLSFILEQDANGLRLQVGSDFNVKISNITILEYQEGMENCDIPYFEGMQSVKMPVLTTVGKNLFDGIIEFGGINANTGLDTTWSSNFRTSFMRVPKNNANFLFTFDYKGLQMSGGYLIIIYYNENKERISSQTVGNREPFNFNQDAYYYRITQNISDNVDILDITNIQLEEGAIATSYEPHKSSILTCNEEVELRGIGDVKDELNLETGELTQRIGEIVLDGSENWTIYEGFAVDGYSSFITYMPSLNNLYESNLPFISPDFAMGTWLSYRNGGENELVWNHDPNKIGIKVKNEKASSVEEIKEFLSTNNIRINYQLATESIKTVDLTVQNQDGNTIPHIQTQQGITHVSTSSDVLTPTVEMSCSYDTIIKPNTTYTIKLDRPIVSDTMYLQVDLGGTMMMLDADVNAFTIKTPSTLSHSQLRLSGTGNTVKEIIVLEGNKVNDKIEYFEGMENVENPILVVSNCPFDNITYKNYQSTTLSLNEPIQLRSIGDVHDEINYETGEYIQRIGEIVLDGSENWQESSTMPDGFYKARINISNDFSMGSREVLLISDRFASYPSRAVPTNHGNCILRPDHATYDIELIISDDDIQTHSLQAFKQYLQDNPTTVQYRLAEPIITKIDTTILDQNNSYKLSQQTYDESTYISVQSDTVVTPLSSVDYEIYSSTGTVTGTSATIENAEAGTPVSGVVYGETLLNVIQEPSETEYVITGDTFEEQGGTLENTVEGNIKSAILKGQTLVNVLDIKASSTYLASKELTGFSFNAIQHSDEQMIFTKGNYKKGSDYTLLFNSDHAFTLQIGHDMTNTEWKRYDIKIGRNIVKVATLSDTSCDYIKLRTDSNIINHEKVTLSNFIILEGDYSSYSMDIPYFEGMQSTKMSVLTATGKNLFDLEKFSSQFKDRTFAIFGNGIKIKLNDDAPFNAEYAKFNYQLKPNTTYAISGVNYQVDNDNFINFEVFTNGGSGDFFKTNLGSFNGVITTNDTGLIQIRMDTCRGGYSTFTDIQIEQGTQATSYEPYKSNILSTPEEVVLRSLPNGVCDTLNLNTGEYVQRIEEHVLDGTTNNASRDWNICWNDYSTNTLTFEGYIPTKKLINTNDSYTTTIPKNFICDKVKVLGFASIWQNGQAVDRELSITTYTGGQLIFVIEKSKLTTMDVFGFKQWLSQNPVTIQYELETPVVKTISTTILDQDDKPTDNLHTFDTTTHINTYAQGGGLIPFINIPENISYDTLLKANTQYTIKLNRTNIVDGTPLTINLGGTELSIEDSTDSFTITTPSTLVNNTLSIGGTNNKVKEVMVIEGDCVDRDLDFFEGFVSVENPIVSTISKNLMPTMDKNNPDEYGTSSGNGTTSFKYNHEVGGFSTDIHRNIFEKGIIGLKPNTTYTISVDVLRNPNSGATYDYGFLWQNPIKLMVSIDKLSTTEWKRFSTKRTTDNNGKFQGFCTVYRGLYFRNIQIEEGIVETPYEPYRGNTLTTYPQVTLRSMGDIKDEWDVVGETVTRRIGEYCIDSFSNYINNNYINEQGYIYFNTDTPLEIKPKSGDDVMVISATLPYIQFGIHARNKECIGLCNNQIRVVLKASKIGGEISQNSLNEYLKNNPITVIYELETPVTESVRITPPNPQTSTASITIPTQLDHVEDTSDFLVWNPYKEHYVRYNYVEDGVVLDNYMWENLTDLNERQFVEFYNKRTYIDQPYHNYVASHDSKGTSKYVLIEPNQDYTVSVRFSELPTCETVKVNLGGAEVEMNVNEPHVHVTTPNTLTNNLCSISGDGLDGKVTDILVIHCLEHEGFADIDYFEGIDGIGEIVEVEGVPKSKIVMEQTNGNLIDEEFEVWNNGQSLRMNDNERLAVHPNTKYVVKFRRDMDKESAYTVYVQLFNKDNVQTRIVNGGATQENNTREFTTNHDETMVRLYTSQITNNGSTHKYWDADLCYADMEKDYIRPRYYDKEEIILPMQLHRINTVYDNLYYDEMKGFYRIQQSIGHKYFVGADSENWTLIERGQRVLRFRYNNADIQIKSLGEYMTNLLPNGTATSPYESCTFNGTTFIVSIDKERLSSESLTAFKEWLANNNLHLYYQLASPLMIDLPEYSSRIEFNTYKDEIYTFFKNCKPTVFTLGVPLDKTYRFYEYEESQGYANRVELTDERMTDEDTLYIDTIHGSGFSNLIENPNNVETLLKPNYQGKAVSHTLTNGKVSSIKVHGFEPNETTIANYNSTLKQYELIVQAQKGQNINTQTLAVPYKLEVYEDGTKDKVYYDEQNKLFRFEGGSVTNPSYNNSYIFNTPLEVFKGIAPRTGLIAEIKVKFNSGTTSARIYYSLDGGATTAYSTLRSMTDEVEYYIGFFNTGGTKLDYATKLSAEAEYINLAPLSSTLPESLIITQIQNISECTFTLDKTYYFDSWIKPLELDVYNGETIITEQSGAIVTINNNGLHKDALTYTDETYTVYWTYVGGEGNVTITLGGTKVEVVGTQGYATLKTAIDGVQDGLIIGGYNLSIKDLMLVKGERIEDLAYFEGSRAVGTAFVDENGETKYKITLVTGSELINDKFENRITFEDNNKHNVVVTKLLGNKPNKK